MKIFIAGATGFVGGHLTAELLRRGHQLVLLSHGRTTAERPDVSYVKGDVTALESYLPAVSGCDAVINLVGIIREFPARGITFERLHVEATACMVAAAQQSGVQRYLQMSALGTRPDAVSGYHRTKWRGEELVRASGLAWTIFRPSLIFGPHDAFVNMLANQLRLTPIMPTMGDGTYRLQPIHGDDVARCYAEALERPETAGQAFELCGADRLTYRELLDAIAEALGKGHPWKPALPLMLMQPLIKALQGFSSFPITSDQLQMLLEENICDGAWRDTFRFEPIHSKEGIKAYLAA
jgi:NADH dehydrogenase